MATFSVLLKNGRTLAVDDVDAYQPEGPMTTFFTTGSSRGTLDSWSTRVASYRTADIVAVQRVESRSTDIDLRTSELRVLAA